MGRFLLACLAALSPSLCAAGAGTLGAAILGGSLITDPDALPRRHTVLIRVLHRYREDPSDAWSQEWGLCSGTLIEDERTILTASHCFGAPGWGLYHARPEAKEVEVVSVQAEFEGEEPVGAGRPVRHPYLDLAAVRLLADAPPSKSPARLVDIAYAVGPQEEVLLSGYGCDEAPGSPPGKLRGATVPYGAWNARGEVVSWPLEFASPEGLPPRGVCQGDSGGSAFVRERGTGQARLLGVIYNSSNERPNKCGGTTMAVDLRYRRDLLFGMLRGLKER